MTLSLDLRTLADVAADLEHERDLLKADRDQFGGDLIRVTQERDKLAADLAACLGSKPPVPVPASFPLYANVRDAMGLYTGQALAGNLDKERELNRGPIAAVLKYLSGGAPASQLATDVERFCNEFLGQRPLIISAPTALFFPPRGAALPDGFYQWNTRVSLEQSAAGGLDAAYYEAGRRAASICSVRHLDPRQWLAFRPDWEPAYWYAYGAMKKGVTSATATVAAAYDAQRLTWLKASIKRCTRAFCRAFEEAHLPIPAVHASPAINAAVTDRVFFEPWIDTPEVSHYSPDLYNRYAARSEAWAESRLRAAVDFAVSRNLIFGLDEVGMAIGPDSAGDNSWWWPMVGRAAGYAASKKALGPIVVFAVNPPEQAVDFDTFDKALFPRGYAALVQTFGGRP